MLALDLSVFPTLRTERLALRELVPEDAEDLFRMRSDVRVMQHIGRPLAATVQDSRDLIDKIEADRRSNAGITWGMTIHNDNTVVGTIGYYRLKPEHHTAEIGYLLRADHWGKGLMSEALGTVMHYGFERFGFHRIEAITSPENKASRRLLESQGFALEGILKENYLWNGKFEDSCIFGRLRLSGGIK